MMFNPAAFAVRRWQFTLLAFGLLALLGINALLTIPRAEDPDIPLPFVIVQAVLPGAEPTEMEQLVANKIEDAIEGLDDVDELYSVSTDGSANIQVRFRFGVNPERKYDEVVREVNALRGTLPAGLTLLEVRRARTTEVGMIQTALVSQTLPMRRLEKVADRLRERLARVPGVRIARHWGVPPSEVRVELDLARLSALRLAPTTVADALRSAGNDAPIGAVHAGERRFNVKSGGAFRDLGAIEAVPVRSVGGDVVRVRDVAKVAWAEDEPTHLIRFNGKRAVLVTVNAREGEDAGRISDAARVVLTDFERTLPAGVKLERGFFQDQNVKHRLDGLQRDFLIAVGLVLITLLPLGFRAGLVVMVSIPLSLLIGLAMLQTFGYSLNQLSIAGFVLSLGLLVDDSIVVTENIARHIREGEKPQDAAINASRQILFAVLGCTATLMLAFLPLMALPGAAGLYIRSLPVSVLCTIAASLLVSLTVIPFLASRWLGTEGGHDANALLRLINSGIHQVYRPILHGALARPWLALGLMVAVCATTLPMLNAIGSSLFPPAESPQFLIKIETDEGSSLQHTDEALKAVERRVHSEPEVKWYVGNLGRGNPQTYYNQWQNSNATNFAEVFVGLKAWNPETSPALVDKLRRDLAHVPGAKVNVVTYENGSPVDAPIVIRINGEDLTVLKRLAAKTEAVLRATPGTRDIGNPLRLDRTDLDLGIHDDKAAALGVAPGAARRVARLALSGEETARFRDPNGDDYAVKVRLPMTENRNDLEALTTIYVPTSNGQALALGTIADPTLRSSPARIDRFARVRTVPITAFIQTGYLTSRMNDAALARLKTELSLPPGYTVNVGGLAKAQSEGFAGLGSAIMVAVFGILAGLVLEFGKFRTALVVAGIIPLGVFGAVTALWLTGNSLSFTATIGIVALIGIEIKNSILLVDLTEQLRRDGLALDDAIERAGEVRFLPVLLTSVTAIGGLLPLAIEHSGLYSPLAIAIIGGLVSSTLLSRVATPVMYRLLASRNEPDHDDHGALVRTQS